jgi:hypothetical protein
LEPGCRFVKTPLSGGWGSPDVRFAFKTSGDLVTTARRFPFAVEVKFRQQWSIGRLFEGKPCPVWAWWRQAQVAAAEQGGLPALWVRKARSMSDWLVLLPDSLELPIAADVVWAGLGRVDYGMILPRAYFSRRLLAVHPRRLARR